MTDVQAILTEELTTLKQRIAENVRRAGKVASGRTLESMHVEASQTEGTLYGGLPTGAPFGTLETGRAPGAVPAGFPEIIRQWMHDKGITAPAVPYKRQPSERWQPKYSPEERGERMMAGAIAHKIETSGTRQFQNGTRSDIYTNEIPAALERIGARIFAGLSLDVEFINNSL